MKNTSLKIAIICGGPSAERGISLNSSRSLSDHLDGGGIEIVPFYFNQELRPFLISKSQLYSNTPSDFDFKLKQTATPLSKGEFLKRLKGCDLVFPAVHGPFGEDGKLQEMLEGAGINFIGSSAQSCREAFNKAKAGEILQENGFFVPASLHIDRQSKNYRNQIKSFFKENKLKKAVIKPTTGGSSIGVSVATDAEQAFKAVKALLADPLYSGALVEPFCAGKEFTVIVLQNRFGMATSLVPVEISVDYSANRIFDYRRKYLPTNEAAYSCPPSFSDRQVKLIQSRAEQVFHLFGLEDLVRIDGWLMPDGEIWFSDINTVSGMEQNSFLFLSAAQIGLTHRDLLITVVENHLLRNGFRLPVISQQRSSGKEGRRQRVNVLFGGETAERQVSLMSGTNVWLKLRNSSKFEPIPYLLDNKHRVWELPYSFTLYHTVEEIERLIKEAPQTVERLQSYQEEISHRLALPKGRASEPPFVPSSATLKEFVEQSKIVFNTVHGGIGENGELQSRFEMAGVKFNGSGSKASRLCMDKYQTGLIVSTLKAEGIYTAPKKVLKLGDLKKGGKSAQEKVFKDLCSVFQANDLIVKPTSDGCSAGVARLSSSKDLTQYVAHTVSGSKLIPAGTLTKQTEVIEMPTEDQVALLFEQFVTTDKIRIQGSEIVWQDRGGWVEVTCGVLGGTGDSPLKAFNPSITIASQEVLSLEEKFQGGTGINITPPPAKFVSAKVVKTIREKVKRVAEVLGIEGYARIDLFVNRHTAEVIVIEANTLPGLTPSTVIYQQALAEPKPLYPREFLEAIVTLGLQRGPNRPAKKPTPTPRQRKPQTRASLQRSL